jgi:hypothetical protein
MDERVTTKMVITLIIQSDGSKIMFRNKKVIYLEKIIDGEKVVIDGRIYESGIGFWKTNTL